MYMNVFLCIFLMHYIFECNCISVDLTVVIVSIIVDFVSIIHLAMHTNGNGRVRIIPTECIYPC